MRFRLVQLGLHLHFDKKNLVEVQVWLQVGGWVGNCTEWFINQKMPSVTKHAMTDGTWE